jgi:hypothetical protein
MAMGPGKYGANAEKLLAEFGGKLCLIIMIGGPNGPSFDVATLHPQLTLELPRLLRAVADSIEEDLKTKVTE